MADEVLQGMSFPEAEWIWMTESMGFSDLKAQLETGELQLVEPKVIVLITGRAEAVEGRPALLNVVRNSLALLRHLHPNTIMLCCAPPPLPKDGQFALAELEGLTDILHRVCKESEYLEYARLGMYLYHKRRVYINSQHSDSVFVLNTEYVIPMGINEAGLDYLTDKLKGKFNSAKLIERYNLLIKRQPSQQLVNIN